MKSKKYAFLLCGACLTMASCSSGGGEKTTESELNEAAEIAAIMEEMDKEDEAHRNEAEEAKIDASQAVPKEEENEAPTESQTVELPQPKRCSTTEIAEMAEMAKRLRIQLYEEEDMTPFKEAVSWLETPYLYAGKDKSGVDCSAFIGEFYQNVYQKKLERRTSEIYGQCDRIDLADAKPGDIIFFHSDGKVDETPNYGGIYLRNNTFIIVTTKKGVVIETLDNNYYKKNFVCVGRPK